MLRAQKENNAVATGITELDPTTGEPVGKQQLATESKMNKGFFATGPGLYAHHLPPSKYALPVGFFVEG